MKLYIENNRHSPKSRVNVYLTIYGDLKIDRKLQKVTEAIYFLSCDQLANKKQTDQHSKGMVLSKNILFNLKQHMGRMRMFHNGGSPSGDSPKDLGMKSITQHQHYQDEADGGTLSEAHFWRKDMWPPQSPDLNPLDYSIWGVLQERVQGTSQPNMESLKAIGGEL